MPSELRALQVLAGRLAALADAVARLRETQARAAQAAAARESAEQLRELLPAWAATVQPTAAPLHRAAGQNADRGTGARRGR